LEITIKRDEEAKGDAVPGEGFVHMACWQDWPLYKGKNCEL
jgi:hypothetical protein